MTEDFWMGLIVGLVAMLAVLMINVKTYKCVLQRIGDAGGSEKINGIWYRITREEGQEKMTEQTKAQRLADALAGPDDRLYDYQLREAATELRRLDANEVALLEVVKTLMANGQDYTATRDKARALITRIETERNAK